MQSLRDSRDDTLGDSLPQSVDLGNVTTSLDTETDVDSLEPLDTDGEDGLVDLVSEDGTAGGVVIESMVSSRLRGRERMEVRGTGELTARQPRWEIH